MEPSYPILVDKCVDIARQMSLEHVDRIASILVNHGAAGIPAARHEILASLPQPRFRQSLSEWLDIWQNQASDISPAGLAVMLAASARAADCERKRQQTELIWTGPSYVGVHLRRTDEALLQVIEAAQHELLLMSYAVYMAPAVSAALVAASRRGVFIRICIETEGSGSENGDYDTVAALGEEVRRNATIYTWRHDARPFGPGDRTGKMHVKCALADQDLAFVSSANLTGHALNLNMELGVLIRGGLLPQQIQSQFRRLVENGIVTVVRQP